MSGFRLVGALAWRGLNEIARVPGAAIPGALAPTIFMLGTYSIFGKLASLPGFAGDDYLSFILPLGMLQGAAFTGAATGVNLARDIESGWFDRLLLAPAPRQAILAGLVLSAALRALIPAVTLLAVGFAVGLNWPGLPELALAFALTAGMACAMAAWAGSLALRFRSQDAAPLMQSSGFILVFFSTAYAPIELLSGWLRTIAHANPVTYVLAALRQGFVTEPSWHDTWPALLAVTGLVAFFSALALRGLARTDS